MVRKKLSPRIFALTSTARPSAIADCTGTITTAKMRVLRSEAQKVSLLKIRTKFWTPTNSAGSGEISRALVKARTNVSPIGMIRNVIIKTPAGSSISRATVPMLLLVGLAVRRGLRPRLGAAVWLVEVLTRRPTLPLRCRQTLEEDRRLVPSSPGLPRRGHSK